MNLKDLTIKQVKLMIEEQRKEVEQELSYKTELNEYLLNEPSLENDDKIYWLVLINHGVLSNVAWTNL